MLNHPVENMVENIHIEFIRQKIYYKIIKKKTEQIDSL